MKRSGPLSRLTPMPPPRQRLRARRQRRTARDRRDAADERSARLIVRERSGGLCEAGALLHLPGYVRGTDYAHRVRRDVGPWCPSNALLLCRAHHDWCHAHPDAARKLGWLLRTTDDPLTTPAYYAGDRLVLLLPDGDLEPYRGPPWP
jgi:hypothetical protein